MDTPPPPPADLETPEGGKVAEADPPAVAPKPGPKTTRPTMPEPPVESARPVTPPKPAPRRSRKTTGSGRPAARLPTPPDPGRRGGWKLAVSGGIGVAAAAALLTLRGSARRKNGKADQPKPDGKAHQADGTDSSQSFDAGIADEGTIPE